MYVPSSANSLLHSRDKGCLARVRLPRVAKNLRPHVLAVKKMFFRELVVRTPPAPGEYDSTLEGVVDVALSHEQ